MDRERDVETEEIRMTTDHLRVGLIGAGGIGKTHLASYAKVEGASIAAVCDPAESSAHAAADQAGAPAYGDVEAMLHETELDAVDICTPTAFHVPSAMLAIEHGLHVLCEKPLATDLETALELVRAAGEKNVLLMTAFCHRFHPPIAFVKKLIMDGKMGEVVMFRNRFAGPNPGVKNTWFSRK